MIRTETDKHKDNGAHEETGAQDRRSSRSEDRHGTLHTPLHPPMRSVAVWGPIAAVTVLAILVILGTWRHVSQRNEQKDFVQRTTQIAVNVATAKRDSGNSAAKCCANCGSVSPCRRGASPGEASFYVRSGLKASETCPVSAKFPCPCPPA